MAYSPYRRAAESIKYISLRSSDCYDHNGEVLMAVSFLLQKLSLLFSWTIHVEVCTEFGTRMGGKGGLIYVIFFGRHIWLDFLCFSSVSRFFPRFRRFLTLQSWTVECWLNMSIGVSIDRRFLMEKDFFSTSTTTQTALVLVPILYKRWVSWWLRLSFLVLDVEIGISPKMIWRNVSGDVGKA